MILCDTGPLVALLDEDDQAHEACVVVLQSLPIGPLLTSLPCLTEAMYLLDRAGGHAAQERLWSLIEDRLVLVDCSGEGDLARIRDLMSQFADVPMDFADATLGVLAERRQLRKIFTLDSDSYVYRIDGHAAFEVLPV